MVAYSDWSEGQGWRDGEIRQIALDSVGLQP